MRTGEDEVKLGQFFLFFELERATLQIMLRSQSSKRVSGGKSADRMDTSH